MSEKVESLLAEVIQIPAAKVSDDLKMKDVDVWDSLKHMELIAALEEAFGVEFTFEEIVNMQGVREIKRVLGERGLLS